MVMLFIGFHHYIILYFISLSYFPNLLVEIEIECMTCFDTGSMEQHVIAINC